MLFALHLIWGGMVQLPDLTGSGRAKPNSFDDTLTTMWYHAVTDFGEKSRYWWNRTRESFVADIIVPFVSKQVKIAKRRGSKTLFNFGSISYLTVIKTERKLKRPAEGLHPTEFDDPEFVAVHTATEEFLDEIKILAASPPSRSILQQSVGKPNKQIFVVMKFGDSLLDSAYEGVIKPIGREFGFEVLRVDEIRDAGHIVQQVLENISQSEIILAELSGQRPNCYYEAGFAHALGKEMIFSIRKNDEIHFDLAGYRFIRWGTESELRRYLRQHLESDLSKSNA